MGAYARLATAFNADFTHTQPKTSAMDAGQHEDKWAALTESLGVEPKPSQAGEPAAEAPAETPAPPAVEHQTPSRPPSAWGDLATQFGLEPEPTPESSVADDPEPAELSANTQADAAIGSPKQRTQKPEVDQPKTAAAEPEEVSVEEPEPAVQQPSDESQSETAELTSNSSDPVERDEPAVPTAPAGFAGTGLTLPDWFPFGGRKKQEPRTPDTALSEAKQETEDETSNTSQDISAELSSSTETGEDAGTAEESADAEAKPRGRRRRGRRRGRGRKSAADSTGNEALPESASQDECDIDKQTPAAGEQTEKPKSISHKNIPAWQDAIGVVVDANIAARSERKRSNRGRGGSRGGRGRRRSGGGSKQES